MKVYVVGHDGPEHNFVISIHRTYEGALKAWNELRKELLREARSSLKSSKRMKTMEDIYKRIIKNLKCKDPKQIDNYPHETPYIQEYGVQE